MRAASLVLVILSGCATVGPANFLPKEQLAFDRARYADDAAVVLHRGDRTELLSDEGWRTRTSRHEAIAVLGEGGLDLAEVRLPFNAKSTLTSFWARVIRPDGTEQVLGAESMLSDTSGKGERDANARFFRFPDVSVGCIMEYTWTIESPWLQHADDQDTLGVFPVRHYDFELKASKVLVIETIELNGGSPIQLRTAADGSHTLRFELANLPARQREDDAPHWTFTEPRWAWRIVAYKWSAYTEDAYRDWKDVVQPNGRKFFTEGKLEKDFQLTVDDADCKDLACKAQRVTTAVQTDTSMDGVRWNRTETLVDALRSRKASVVERALMVKALLERRDVDVWLAYGTGALGRQPMPTFPNVEQFDRLFVYLPKQKGLPEPLLIDPACDACTVGQLPLEYTGTRAFIFKTSEPLGKPSTVGRWESVTLDAPVTDTRLTHQLALQPGGDVDDDLTFTVRGPFTSVLAYRHRVERKKLKEREAKTVRRSSPLADLTSTEWTECSAQRCGFHSNVRYVAEASQDGARWLVPTTFLRDFHEGLYLPEQRQSKVHLDGPADLEETAELAVPPGLTLVTLPPSVKTGFLGFNVEVKWERTPAGARVTRTLKHDVLAVERFDYPDLRAAVEAFRRARREVLVFAPKP